MEEEVTKKPNFFKRRWKLLLIIFGIIIALAVGALIALKAFDNDLKSKKRGEVKVETGCKKPEFTYPFTDLSKIDAINKLGSFGAGSQGRSYSGIKEGMEVPVYAPTDATLETVIYTPRGGPETPPEYGLYFDTGCNVRFLLDHIDRVTDEIKALAPQSPASSTRTELGTKPNKKIKAGTLLGYSNGTPQARTFDFLVMNYANEVEHINPSRWTNDQTKYSVCPYDYYISPYKEQFLAKVGINSQGVFTPEDCGKPSQDIQGTLSGGWFKGDSKDSQGEFLGIGQNSARTEIVIRKDGMLTDVNLQDWTLGKKKPKDVKAGEQICYSDQGSNVWAWIRLDMQDKIAFAKGSGKCPAAFPESQSEQWER